MQLVQGTSLTVTSRSNPTIKAIRALRTRKEREARGLFVVEGIRLVAEALHLHAPVETLIVAPGLLHRHPFGREVVAAQPGLRVPMLEVSDDVFASLSRKDGPQGLAAVVRQRWDQLADTDPGEALAWVALEAIQDPGNLGSILRTADAVGAGGSILVGPTVDPHDPTAVRASMGAIFAQRLIRADIGELSTWAQRHDLHVIGTSDSAATVYTQITYHRPTLLLMGSEREGLSPALQSLASEMVRIPMLGRGDSLNLAVATSLVLYEMLNRGLRTED